MDRFEEWFNRTSPGGDSVLPPIARAGIAHLYFITMLCMLEEGPGGFKGGMSAEKYIRLTETSRATATRDLQDLVEKGALIRHGEFRHTRYFLAISDQVPANS
jgi:hypothetical protein